MSNEWLNDLRRKMEGHTEDVPDGLWKSISEELFVKDEDQAIPGLVPTDLKAQKAVSTFNHLPIWYRIGGVAAAIGLFLILGKLFYFHEKKQQKDFKKEYGITGINVQNRALPTPAHQEEIVIQNIEKEIFNPKMKPYNPTVNALQILSQNSHSVIGNSGNFKDHVLFKQSPAQKIKESTTAEKYADDEDETGTLMTKEEREWKEKFENDQKAKLAKHKTEKWMFGLSTGNASSNATDQFPGYATLNGTTPSLPEMWGLETGEDPLMAILLANQDKKVEATIRHKTPVTLGALVYKSLGKRWSVGVGISYTKLAADLTSGSPSDFISSEQNIHYVGIPVQVNYNVVTKGAFTGYLTGGGSVEKAVDGDIRTNYIVDGVVKQETKEKISQKPVQVSLNTGVGVQLKVLKQIGIYAEPGIGYHFKDNSSLNTIYKEKPLNFNLRFGIRLLLDQPNKTIK